MNLPTLLVLSNKPKLRQGNIIGTCVLCSQTTESGIRSKDVISGNFTGWGYFYSGNCFCPICAYLFTEHTFRRKSWVVSRDEFRIFKNDEALDIILDPPNPPFFIYLAKIGQKQSWLTSLHKVSQSREIYFIAHEKYDVSIPIKRSEAAGFAENAKIALDYGITKTELLRGEFHPRTWRLAIEGGYESFLNELKRHKKNLTWEVIVDVTRGRAKNNKAAGDSLQHCELAEDANIEESARHLQPSSAGGSKKGNTVRSCIETQQLLWPAVDPDGSDGIGG